MIVCLFCFVCLSVVYLVRAVNPRISNLTATAAETYANITWEYEGPGHVTFYVEYGVAGSKTQFITLLSIWGTHFKRLRIMFRIYFGPC